MPRGGERSGSGRPLLGEEKRGTYSFSLKPSIAERVGVLAKARGQSKSQALESLLEHALEEAGLPDEAENAGS